MTRFLITAALLLATAAPALAQDMPLSQILIDGEGWKKVEGKPEKPELNPLVKKLGLEEAVTARSPDCGTLFIARANQRFLFAIQYSEEPPALGIALAEYAPLRTARGEKTIEVTGLVTDRDGRIYAATKIGVQVFDPTGRLCGVLTPAAPGKPEHMTFEGDTLTLWIGDTKYARKLNTQGVK